MLYLLEEIFHIIVTHGSKNHTKVLRKIFVIFMRKRQDVSTIFMSHNIMNLFPSHSVTMYVRNNVRCTKFVHKFFFGNFSLCVCHKYKMKEEEWQKKQKWQKYLDIIFCLLSYVCIICLDRLNYHIYAFEWYVAHTHTYKIFSVSSFDGYGKSFIQLSFNGWPTTAGDCK